MAEAQIRITAQVGQATRDINNVKNALGSLDKQVQNNEKAMRSLGSSTNLAVNAAKALAAAFSVSKIIDYTTTWTDLNSRLINATGSTEDATEALAAIGETARRTFQPLEQTADVFLRNSLALTDLGYTTNEQIKISELLNNTLAVSGTRGQQAASAINAFSKAIGEGRVTTETLNTLMNTNSRLVRAMADSLGVSIAELRNMASEGRLNTGPMLDKLTSQMQKVSDEAEAMPATITDAFVVLNNAFLSYIGSVDQSAGITQVLAGVIVHVADNIDELVTAAAAFMAVMAVGKIIAVARALQTLVKTIRAVGVATAFATGGVSALLGGLAAIATYVGLQIFSDDEADNAVEMARQARELEKAVSDAEAAAARKARETATISKETQKIIDNYQQTINKLQENVRLQQDILKYGEEEAKIRQVIRQEQEKYAGASATTIRNLIEQEDLLRRIASRQTEVNNAIRGMMDSDESDRIEAYTRLTNAQNDLTLAIKSGEQAAIDAARSQVQALEIAYNNEVIKKARSKVEILRIEDEAAKQIENINANLRNLISIGFDQESELYRQLQNEKLRIAEETAKRIENIELARIERTLMAERSGIAQALSDSDRALLQRKGAEERQSKIVKDRIEFEKKSDSEKTKFAIDNLQSIFSALGAQNKKAFEANKALAIASALVNTYQGATKALATYPFPFNLIAAAGAVAAGLAQVSAIRSQQYSGRQLGGPVMGGKSYIVGENGPEVFTPTSTGNVTRNRDAFGGGGQVNVNFTIVANDTQGFDQLLSSRKGVITQIISDAMLERGTRSMI